MIEYLAIFIPVISLFIYAALFLIECGASVFMVWPKLLEGGADVVRAQVTPIWEATNVFLVFAIISLIALFPGAMPAWGNALIIPLFLFLAVVGIRVLGMLYLFYKKGESRAMKAVLLVANLLAPAVLVGGVIPFFLIGVLPYNASTWGLTIAIGLIDIAAAVLFGALFFNYVLAKRSRSAAASPSTPTTPEKHVPLRMLILASLGCLLLFYILAELFLRTAAPHVFSWHIFIATAIAGIIIFIAFVYMPSSKKIVAMIQLLLGALLFGVAYFTTVAAQLPYIIYPSFTIFNSFTDPQSATILLGICAAGLIIVIPSFALLYALFIA